MGRIEADIVLESWLFGFWPCSGQGQFTPPMANCNEKHIINHQLRNHIKEHILCKFIQRVLRAVPMLPLANA